MQQSAPLHCIGVSTKKLINNRFVPYKEEFDNHGWKLHLLSVYSYFKRGCQKKCACDNPKGNMGYYQHTVPETIAVEPTLVAFL